MSTHEQTVGHNAGISRKSYDYHYRACRGARRRPGTSVTRGYRQPGGSLRLAAVTRYCDLNHTAEKGCRSCIGMVVLFEWASVDIAGDSP